MVRIGVDLFSFSISFIFKIEFLIGLLYFFQIILYITCYFKSLAAELNKSCIRYANTFQNF
jgi:hypothetical protein